MPPFLVLVLVGSALAHTAGLAIGTQQPATNTRRITWDDLPTFVQQYLAAQRTTDRTTFDAYLESLSRDHARRVREGTLDHLVHYVLQSRAFTRRSPIEPARSAQRLVSGLSEHERRMFLDGAPVRSVIPAHAADRISDFARTVERASDDPRLHEFRRIARVERGSLPIARWLTGEYVRAMRFLYAKEFVAASRADPAAAISLLYATRGLSTDTALENGYAAAEAIAAAARLRPSLRVTRALVVGPGLDLAPRTGLQERIPPQSLQPYLVADAIAGAGLGSAVTLRVDAVDINPRVVAHLEKRRGTTVRLQLRSALGDTHDLTLTPDYREYVHRLGRGLLGDAAGAAAASADRHLMKTVVVPAHISARISASRLDITCDRLATDYDLIVVTNVFPYLAREELLLALTNIAAALTPGGLLIHNEPRSWFNDAMPSLGLPLLHARSVTIATSGGSGPPVFDAVWIHESSRRSVWCELETGTSHRIRMCDDG